jgi:hypothetical protein
VELFTLVLAIYGAVVATASVVIAARAHKAQGPKLSVTGHGVENAYGRWAVIAATNSGRGEVTIDRMHVSVAFGHDGDAVNQVLDFDESDTVGPSLPHRIHGHSATKWFVDVSKRVPPEDRIHAVHAILFASDLMYFDDSGSPHARWDLPLTTRKARIAAIRQWPGIQLGRLVDALFDLALRILEWLSQSRLFRNLLLMQRRRSRNLGAHTPTASDEGAFVANGAVLRPTDLATVQQKSRAAEPTERRHDQSGGPT